MIGGPVRMTVVAHSLFVVAIFPGGDSAMPTIHDERLNFVCPACMFVLV